MTLQVRSGWRERRAYAMLGRNSKEYPFFQNRLKNRLNFEN